mmetsp:Transcript_15636/g.52686  ORF Transcript_15636/g.52686 Transcript_15636/m.52686 type:complete len:473 (+) Transcript_15636:55-1473(+)
MLPTMLAKAARAAPNVRGRALSSMLTRVGAAPHTTYSGHDDVSTTTELSLFKGLTMRECTQYSGGKDLSPRQATDAELLAWLTGPVGLNDKTANDYAKTLQSDGFDSPRALALATVEELERRRIRVGHARSMLARLEDFVVGAPEKAASVRLFSPDVIRREIQVADAIEAVEAAFGKLARGEVDVPLPMHIGIHESSAAGPGDCHVKGGYVLGEETFTVKLACVSFYKNLKLGLSPGSGVFCVMSAQTGQPLAIFHENRYLTDLRTGAAGGVALKHLAVPATKGNTIGFIGCGAIARVMARAAAAVRPGFRGVAYARDAKSAQQFCEDMSAELGCTFDVAVTAQQLCRSSDVIYTQTPGSATVLEKSWLKPWCTIIASGSDQPTKQELPIDVLAASKYVSDLTKQTSRVGELRSAIAAKAMTEESVYAELGEIVNGSKPGRVGDELIVVDLTGTGAQDAAIGQVAWDKLRHL